MGKGLCCFHTRERATKAEDKMDSSEARTSSGREYQVFLSFRGPDTRRGFTDYLYHSLTDAGICVFRDDEELRVGERIDGALQKAIDNSKIYIPIFSQTYASSQWCLDELAQMVENTSKSNENKEILPIFFDVKPKDVKMKTRLYRYAILKLKCKKKLNTKQVDLWREALKMVGAIKGWEVMKNDGQGELIKSVVEEVVVKLKTKQKSVTEHLIGIDDRVTEVRNLLEVHSGGVWLIQIHGMGGIGKTTLAKVVFNKLSTHFGKCCCFLENVRENSSMTNGLVELQKKLLSEIGNAEATKSINATDYGMKRIEETLCDKKVFIVLDDVDESEQVEKLVGKGALCSGSRVLITTRNNDLRITRPKYDILKYEMEVMRSDHALKLFSRHAFNEDSPSNDRYEISKKIVSATGRLPLTIEVIGSLLHGKTQELWNETLNKLCKAPPKGVFEKLRISYDALIPQHQQIFLDIACFFIGEEMTNPIYMWTDCGFFPVSGIEVLKNKSLIKIGDNNKFLMHDQLRDLGRGIICQENLTNPEERSRLWDREEVLNTIRTKKMRNNIQAMELHLHAPIPRKEIRQFVDDPIRSEEIKKFETLRFLRLYGGTFVGDLTDCFPKLTWIHWGDPLQTDEPTELTNMRLNNVVILEFSRIPFIDDKKLWNFIKEARKLKVLRIEGCDGITRTPNLSGCSNLERLTFYGCFGLKKIDNSIGMLECLKELKFHHCRWLEGLPKEIGDLRNLEILSLEECHEIRELPDSIFNCKDLRKLHLSSIGPMELSGDIGKLENLEVLWVETNLKGQLPFEIGLLSRLQKLVLRQRYRNPLLFQLFTNQEVSSTSLQVVPDLSNLTNLVELDIHDGFEIHEQYGVLHTGDLRWIGRLSELKQLRLGLLHVPAPTELASLSQLNELWLSGLNLQPLMQVPSSLALDKSNSMAFLPFNLKNLSYLQLSDIQMQEIQLDGLRLPNLTKLSLVKCGTLERFMLSSMRMLKEIDVGSPEVRMLRAIGVGSPNNGACPKLDEIHIAGLLESLESLRISDCESFRGFVYIDIHWEYSQESSLILASRVFNKLRRLCLQIVPKILSIQVVDTWESLKYLILISCHHLESLGGLSNLKNLESLTIYYCHELRIVEGLDELKLLKKLDLIDCPSLESLIDVSTSQLPNDCHLSIQKCRKLYGVEQGFHGFVQHFKHYKEKESVPAALTDQLMVGHAEGSTQERMRVPGKMEEPLAPFKRSPGFQLLEDQIEEEEEDHDAGESNSSPCNRPSSSS